MRLIKLILCLGLIVFSVTAEAQDPIDILRKSEEKLQGATSAQSEITISIVRPKWTREMGIKSWSKGDEHSLILITSPAREKGTAFLKRNKEIWNWVPSIERTVKLPPSMMMQSWMGTDFTNDDLVRESSLVKDYTHEITGDSTLEGRNCYKIVLTPKPDAPVVWGKVIVFVDQDDYIQLRGEMYDEDGYLVNVMNASDIKEMDGRLIATKTELIPVEKEGHKTVMQIDNIAFDVTINDDFFTTRNMKRVK